jgi:hypothetical protein
MTMIEGTVGHLISLAPGIRSWALATYVPYVLGERRLKPYPMSRAEWAAREMRKADLSEAQRAMLRRVKRDLGRAFVS